MYLIFEFVNVGGIFGLLVTLSIILGMTFHEWGHYFTYNYFEKKKSAFIVRKLGAIQIVRTSLYGKENVVVSVMGPAVPFMIACVLALILYFVSPLLDEELVVALWFCVISFGLHILLLIPFFKDGEQCVNYLLKKNF